MKRRLFSDTLTAESQRPASLAEYTSRQIYNAIEAVSDTEAHLASARTFINMKVPFNIPSRIDIPTHLLTPGAIEGTFVDYRGNWWQSLVYDFGRKTSYIPMTPVEMQALLERMKARKGVLRKEIDETNARTEVKEMELFNSSLKHGVLDLIESLDNPVVSAKEEAEKEVESWFFQDSLYRWITENTVTKTVVLSRRERFLQAVKDHVIILWQMCVVYSIVAFVLWVIGTLH